MGVCSPNELITLTAISLHKELIAILEPKLCNLLF